MAILTANYSEINHEEMATAIGLKPKHIPMLIGSFLEESESILSALDSAIASVDYDEIKARSHAIKGSAGNLRFNEVYEMAKDMEHSAEKVDASFDYSGHFSAIKEAISTIQN